VDYIDLKLSSFRLSDFSLWWIKKEKMTTTNIYKKRWEYKKNTLKWKKNISVNKLIVLCKRIEYWLGSGLELLSAWFIEAVCRDSGILQIQKEPLSITWEFLKSTEGFWRPSVFSNVGISCLRFHIPCVFFFPSFKASDSFAYITPWAVSTRYFVDHI